MVKIQNQPFSPSINPQSQNQLWKLMPCGSFNESPYQKSIFWRNKSWNRLIGLSCRKKVVFYILWIRFVPKGHYSQHFWLDLNRGITISNCEQTNDCLHSWKFEKSKQPIPYDKFIEILFKMQKFGNPKNEIGQAV